jgi:hypothetical protein
MLRYFSFRKKQNALQSIFRTYFALTLKRLATPGLTHRLKQVKSRVTVIYL